MNKLFKFLIFVCIIIFFHFTVVELIAQTINARLTTSIYSWQQHRRKTESANHVRAYQLARFSIGNLGIAGLSFHTYFNLSQDFAEKAVNDPRVWIYNCYFDLKAFKNTTNFSIGRQRIYAGVGYGTIDGLQVKYKFKDYFKLKVYAGTLAPLRKSYRINKVTNDNISWGFHITSIKLKKVQIGLSYAQHTRIPVRYRSSGIYTRNFRLRYPLTSLQKQLVGIDLKSFITTKFNIQGRLDYNFSNHSIRRGEAGIRYNPVKNIELGLSYIYRTPFIDINSIFSIFALNPNQEIAFHSNYRWKNYRFFFNLATVLFEGANNQRIRFGCGWKQLYLGYNYRAGYGGDIDGLNANFRIPLKKKLNITLGSNFASYKLANKRFKLFSGSLGINYYPNKRFSLQLATHLLKNKLFDYDFRFFIRGSYALFHRF